MINYSTDHSNRNAPPFFVFNTHLDYESFEARKNGLHLILSKMRAISNGLPCILTGDFNSTPHEGLIAEVTNPNCATKWGMLRSLYGSLLMPN